MSAPTLAEIRAASKGVGGRGYFLMTVARPAGPYLAWIAFRAGLGPRHVTYTSLVFAIGIIALAAYGGHTGTWLGPALIVAWEALDVTDGTMARALRKRDNFGGFVDYSAGVLLIAFLPIAMAVGAAGSPDGSLGSFFARIGVTIVPGAAAIVACGAATSAISMYMRVLNRTLEVRFGASIAADGAPGPAQSMLGAVRLVVRNFETIGGVQALVWSIAAATGYLELALFAYLLFHAALFVAYAVSVYRNYSTKTEYLRPPANPPAGGA